MGDGLAAPHAKEIKKKMAQKDAKGKTAERQPALTFALTILAPLQSAPHIKQNTRGKPWAKLSCPFGARIATARVRLENPLAIICDRPRPSLSVSFCVRP
ncbi:MAG: hypothetical protein QOE88_322 [Verrucomicrobiota bacterium]|nr:hypothetical protein [Verrucomicrobiota bacterium]